MSIMILQMIIPSYLLFGDISLNLLKPTCSECYRAKSRISRWNLLPASSNRFILFFSFKQLLNEALLFVKVGEMKFCSRLLANLGKV